MRSLLLIMSMLLLTACYDAKEQARIVVPASAQQVSLAVSNMTCSSCGPTVRRALQQVPGVYKATVDVRRGIATAYIDPARVEVRQLTQATTNAGYPSRAL
ncbi:MAG: mercuric transport protein periplasmic component [Gammaproteobacteria bacterium]|nr:mercuric transport protein periplasmic component [Gammaproteobacteria bacterium]